MPSQLLLQCVLPMRGVVPAGTTCSTLDDARTGAGGRRPERNSERVRCLHTTIWCAAASRLWSCFAACLVCVLLRVCPFIGLSASHCWRPTRDGKVLIFRSNQQCSLRSRQGNRCKTPRAVTIQIAVSCRPLLTTHTTCRASPLHVRMGLNFNTGNQLSISTLVPSKSPTNHEFFQLCG